VFCLPRPVQNGSLSSCFPRVCHSLPLSPSSAQLSPLTLPLTSTRPHCGGHGRAIRPAFWALPGRHPYTDPFWILSLGPGALPRFPFGFWGRLCLGHHAHVTPPPFFKKLVAGRDYARAAFLHPAPRTVLTTDCFQSCSCLLTQLPLPPPRSSGRPSLGEFIPSAPDSWGAKCPLQTPPPAPAPSPQTSPLPPQILKSPLFLAPTSTLQTHAVTFDEFQLDCAPQ
jgi:hypothetical protein